MAHSLLRSLLFALLIVSLFSLSLQQYNQIQKQKLQEIFNPISQQVNQAAHPTINKLVFITPWNNEGKRLPLKYAHKLKYISPCWYELVIKDGKVVFYNDQLIDRYHLKQITQANPQIRILPRVYVNSFEVFQQIEMQYFSSQNMINSAQQYSGIVWDSPYDLFLSDKTARPLNNFIVQFVNSIKKTFDAANQQSTAQKLLLFFNMANPSNRQLDNALYTKLNIDGLLIQNYDSPLDFLQLMRNSVRWVQRIKPKAQQIFMMVPFFSYKNGAGTSTLDVKKQLDEDGITSADMQRSMCRFNSRRRNKYIVPCYQYFNNVYQILQKEGISAGYWEGGNGLENYYLFM